MPALVTYIGALKMNRWDIPDWLECEVITRDRQCIYCGVSFELNAFFRGSMPTWEHIVNDAKIITRENIARCCSSCNASKGAKDLAIWLESAYCHAKGITYGNIADVARDTLNSPPSCDPA